LLFIMVFAARAGLLALASMTFLMDRANGHGHHHHGGPLDHHDDHHDHRELEGSGSWCGGHAHSTVADEDIVDAYVDARKKYRKDRQLLPAEEVHVLTHFHIITNGTDGDVSAQQIDDSLEVINAAYKSSGFVFDMGENTTTTVNSLWFNLTLGGTNEYDMKTALRVGGAADLNVYILDTRRAMSGITLGWGTFPNQYLTDPIYDGVVILYDTVPGGSRIGRNEGDTFTHELGHWLGLVHPFDGGCDGFGDGVVDTPAENLFANSLADFTCAEGKDTCPLQDGLDAIHNFMVRRFSSLLFFAEPVFFEMSQPLPFFRFVLSF
jgi:hypothetical protein